MLSVICILYLLLPFQVALNPLPGFDVASVRVIIPLLVLGWLVTGLIRRHLTLPERIQTPLILSFLFLSAFSLVGAQEISWGLRKLLFLFSFFPFYFVLAALLDTEAKILRLTKSLVFGSFALAIVGIFQFLLQFVFSFDALFRFWTRFVLPPFLGASFARSVADYPSIFVNIGGHTMMRAVAIFPDPHMLSFYLGLTAPLAIGIATLKFDESGIVAVSPKHRGFFFFAAATMLLADLLTFSRGGYLGLIGGLLFLFVLQYRSWSTRIRKTVFASVVLAAVIVIASPIGARLATSFDTGEGSNQGRIAMWKTASNVIMSRPLLGVGLGNYPLSVKPDAGYRDPIYAHNLFLDIAAETGIVNAILFLTLLMTSFFSLLARSKSSPFFLWPAISIVVFTAHGLVETPLYSVHIMPLLVFLLAIGSVKKA